MPLPIVAVVGRPNVGKSTFVNRIAQADEAIVHEMRGVTRDRSYHEADWNGVHFTLVDTGGIEMGDDDAFQGSIRAQAFEATREADVIVFLVDGRTGINADERYLRRIIPNLSKVTGLELVQASDLIDATQNLDGLVAVSGAVKTCAVNLSKMSNDLRLMSSGPRCGFSEINLPPRQNGSSIMPGKVNPVIPEVVSQVAFNIIGNDVTVTMAAEAGQLELNAFEPIIFWNLTHAVEFLTYAVNTLVDNCVVGITANRERCKSMVDASVGTITALCPHIGYEAAAVIAKKAIDTGAPVRELILQAGLLDEAALDKILDPFSMTEPGISAKELLD